MLAKTDWQVVETRFSSAKHQQQDASLAK